MTVSPSKSRTRVDRHERWNCVKRRAPARGKDTAIVSATMGWKGYFQRHPSGIPACSEPNAPACAQCVARHQVFSQRALLLPTEAGGWVEWPMTAVERTRPAHCHIIVVKEVHSDGAGSGEGLDGAP